MEGPQRLTKGVPLETGTQQLSDQNAKTNDLLTDLFNKAQELSQKAEEQATKTEWQQKITELQQSILDRLYGEVKHSQTIVVFGFIVLIVMLIAIIIDVTVNVWGKAEQPQSSAPVIIYTNGKGQ